MYAQSSCHNCCQLSTLIVDPTTTPAGVRLVPAVQLLVTVLAAIRLSCRNCFGELN